MIFPVRSTAWRVVFGVACWCAAAGAAVAQGDVTTRARAEAAAGRRAEGIALLETHLTATPGDVDARLVYGLILSWDGQYDQARAALSAVLAQAPDYLDARVALMNVEWWSGRTREARDQVKAVLARDAGNPQARLVQQRLDARTRPWSAGVSLTIDAFNDGRESWDETAMSIGRETPIGSLIVRGAQAGRFGLDDRQLDIEFYPTFRAGSYAFIGVAMGADQRLYPKRRVSVDLYQAVGGGVEVSAGFRQLNFLDATRIYLGSISKYAGHWLIAGKASVVPDDSRGDSWSYHASARRYFGASGTSYIGAGYSHGFSREEPRGEGDFISVDADTLRGHADVDVTERLRLSIGVSVSRQERLQRVALWQTTAGAGLVVRF